MNIYETWWRNCSSNHKLQFSCRLITDYRIWSLYWRKMTLHFPSFISSFSKYSYFAPVTCHILCRRYLWSAPYCHIYYMIILGEKSYYFNVLLAELASEWDKEYIHLKVITFPLTEEKKMLFHKHIRLGFCFLRFWGISFCLLGWGICNMQYFHFMYEKTIDFSALPKISLSLWYERVSSYLLNTSHVYFTRWSGEVSLAPACLSFIFQLIYRFSRNSFDQMTCGAKWDQRVLWSVLRVRRPNSCSFCCQGPAACW